MLEEVNVAKAYAEINGDSENSPTNILTKYRNEYSVSIENFADEVKSWLDKQEPGFRLNFYVDEVGQFIGSNTHLMLNLQTIAESLSTKCGGGAWVFVTSQEDMDKVVGDRTKQQGTDFSKIQARFKTRLKLTSADVEEVIRKRLLEKNEAGKAALGDVYAGESANFKTLFDLVDGAKTYRNYTDESHFVDTYPFVSYQFPLFQEAIEGISDHNVFEGRHSSVGERSMLGVVQQVAKDIGNVEVGQLATFDHMFAGIRTSLKSAPQRAIQVAESNLGDELGVRLLKALFLVKYVESFQATARNLTVLVYDRFGLDLPALSKRVQDALNVLETQTYVQRKGNVYEYLTNEEKEIEEEIKNVDIDASDVSNRLFKILSGDVIKTNKFRYAKNGQDFAFGYKLDDQVYGQQRELAVHFITPEYPYEPGEIRMHSAGKDELRVILDPDERVLADLRLLIKTEKYIKRKQTAALSAIEGQILNSKAAQDVELEKELIDRLKQAVGKAALVVNAADLTSASQDAVTRVTDGFQGLISRTYTLLSLLGGTTYSEQQIASYVNPDPGMFDDASFSTIAPAGDEVLSAVIRRKNETVTVKTIVDEFQAKPYGWDLASIEVVIAWLIGTSKLTLTLDGNALKRSEVTAVLRNTQKHANAVIGPQKVFDEPKVAAFRKFCIDFFDEPAAPKDPVELARHGSDKLRGKLDELKALTAGSSYPFLAQLDAPVGLLEQVVGQPDEWYLSEFGLGDELLDAKDSVIDPIQSFLHGGQRMIYDDAARLLSANAGNIAYLPDDSDAEVRRLLEDPNAFRGNRMTQLKQAADELESQLEASLGTTRQDVLEPIEGRKTEVIGSSDFSKASEEARTIVVRTIDDIVLRVGSERQIGLIRNLGYSFEQITYPALLDQLAASAQPSTGDEGGEPKPIRQTVSVKTIDVPSDQQVLETDDDIEQYLDSIRTALRATLESGKRIAV